MQDKCLAEAKEVATHKAGFRPGCWCLCGPGPEKTSKYDEDRPSHPFADGDWDKLASVMTSELTISNHPVSKCSNIAQTGVLMKRKQGGGAGTHFKNEKSSHARESDLGVQLTLSVFCTERGFRTRCQFRLVLPSWT